MLKASTIWRMRSICGRRVLGHLGAGGFIVGENLVPEGLAGVESYGQVIRLFLLENAQQFAGKAVDSRGRFAFRGLPAWLDPPAVRAKYMR